MKVRVNVCCTIEVEVNEEVFTRLHKIHQDITAYGEGKDYKEAEEIIINKLLARCELNNGEEILSVYAEDNIPILEF